MYSSENDDNMTINHKALERETGYLITAKKYIYICVSAELWVLTSMLPILTNYFNLFS